MILLKQKLTRDNNKHHILKCGIDCVLAYVYIPEIRSNNNVNIYTSYLLSMCGYRICVTITMQPYIYTCFRVTL